MKVRATVLSLLISSSAYSAPQSNREEFASRYPDIEEGSSRPENKKILCPFHRLLERAGLYDTENGIGGSLLVSILKVTQVTKEFGCAIQECGTVATAVSAGQLPKFATSPGLVNLQALHKAFGVSHECGFTWDKGGSVVSDVARRNSLAKLQARADSMGRLSIEDLYFVKDQICAEQGERTNNIQSIEVKLIYSFLGGKDRGFIELDDVSRFFHAELPKTIGTPSGL